jgi:hypothetical protein
MILLPLAFASVHVLVAALRKIHRWTRQDAEVVCGPSEVIVWTPRGWGIQKRVYKRWSAFG